MDGKYLEDARHEMETSLEADDAGDRTPVSRTVLAVLESLTELEQGVSKIEAGGPGSDLPLTPKP